jgi:hypothetical protein
MKNKNVANLHYFFESYVKKIFFVSRWRLNKAKWLLGHDWGKNILKL